MHAAFEPTKPVARKRSVGAEIGGETLDANTVLRAPKVEHLARLVAEEHAGIGGQLHAVLGTDAELIVGGGCQINRLGIGPNKTPRMICLGPKTGSETEIPHRGVKTSARDD